MINYVQGDATLPQGDGLKVIAHVCNDVGAWGAGFTEALDTNQPKALEWFDKWRYRAIHDPPYILGSTLIRPITDPPTLFIAHMVAQDGLPQQYGRPPIRYGYLQSCLEAVANFARDNRASVHMPRIGCGLARGKWEAVEPIIHATLIIAGIKTYVYDLPKS